MGLNVVDKVMVGGFQVLLHPQPDTYPRALHVIGDGYTHIPTSFRSIRNGYMSLAMVTSIYPRAFVSSAMVTCHRQWLHHPVPNIILPNT
jgi:hypothetical protein